MKQQLTLASFNVNSVRKRIESRQLAELIALKQPDVIGLQETKVRDEEFPQQTIRELGYHSYFFGQKTHYGVALLSREPLTDIRVGYPWDDEQQQRRLISASIHISNGRQLHLINGYFPQGENRNHPIKFPAKRRFYADLMRYLHGYYTPHDSIVIMGDMNISPEDTDIGIGEKNRLRWLQTGKCSFLPEERDMMTELKAWGFTDSFRYHQPHNTTSYSWFDYRSRGFEDDPKRGLRIDLILLSQALVPAITGTGIDYKVRAMPQPSDHAPVWVTLDLTMTG